MSRFLGIDVGSGSVKMAVTDTDGTVLAFDQVSHSPRSPHTGWVEFDTQRIWSLVLVLARRLGAAHPGEFAAVRGIGLSVLCPGLIAMDDAGSPLFGAITFSDNRSAADVEELAAALDPVDLFRVSGNRLMPGACSVTSMLWIRRHRPDVYARTAFFGHLNSFLGRMMTGKVGIDPSNASYTGLFETAAGVWSGQVAQRLGLDSAMLPPIVPSHMPIGVLQNDELLKTGLPRGIAVAMGGGDTACSALAVGAVSNGDLFESVGTTNVITLCSNVPEFDERFMNRCHVVPDRWLYHGAMSSTGAALVWLRDSILEASSQEVFTQLLQRAAAVDPAEPVPLFLPYMAGERTPVWDPHASGVLFGCGLETRREHILRAVLEGCGFGTRQILAIVEEIVGRTVDCVLSIGGGAKIEEWTQIKADITGRSHTVLHMNNAAVVGAALLATAAAGDRSVTDLTAEAVQRFRNRDENAVWRRFVPNPAWDKAYDRRYQVYCELYPALRPLFKRYGAGSGRV